MINIVNDELFIRIFPKKNIIFKKSPVLNSVWIKDSLTGEELTLRDDKAFSVLPPQIISDMEQKGLLKVKKFDIIESVGLYKVTLISANIVLENKIAGITEEVNLETLASDFMKLEDFMKNALYIGRNFISQDINAPKYILLYEFNGVYLLKSYEDDKYIFISKHLPVLKNYEIRDFVKEYYDKKSVVLSIIKQEERRNNENRNL